MRELLTFLVVFLSGGICGLGVEYHVTQKQLEIERLRSSKTIRPVTDYSRHRVVIYDQERDQP